jgi:hypothetical protein
MLIDKDLFSSGQITSKLWLCEELEKLNWSSNLTRIYGGWCGVLPFLLLSRGIFDVKRIESYDLDPSCEPIADMINENWLWQNWKFKAHTLDCNTLTDNAADVVINTSTEHFSSRDWFSNLSNGTKIVLQGNNMKHEDEDTHQTNSLIDFKSQYPLSEYLYEGSKDFVYPEWKFTRYMIIGIV